MTPPKNVVFGGGAVLHNYYSITDNSNETLVLFNGNATLKSGTTFSAGFGPDAVTCEGHTDVKPMLELKASQKFGQAGNVKFSGFSRFRFRYNNENSTENKIQSRVGITAEYNTGKKVNPYITFHGTNKGDVNKIGAFSGLKGKNGYLEYQIDRNVKTGQFNNLINFGLYF